MKRCCDCGVEKPRDQFWANQSSPDGLAYYCKQCFGERNRLYAERRARREGRDYTPRKKAPPVTDGERWCFGCDCALPLDQFIRNRNSPDGRGNYCRPCQGRMSTESRQRLHGTSRHYHLMRRYGIGAGDVDRMLDAQAWACPVCRVTLTLKTAHVDHDHQTGAVRGILCFNCNGGLGQFRDSPEVLRRAADYLELDLEDLLAPEPTEADAIRRLEAAFGRTIDVA